MVLRDGFLKVENNVVLMNAVEINAVRQCNLSCRACSHSAPLHGQQVMDIGQLAIDLHFLSGFLHCQFVRVVGGEPTLHPKLHDLISTIKASKIADKICLVTNGTLLHTFDKEFLVTLDKIEISLYPLADLVSSRIRKIANSLSDSGGTVTILEYSDFRESITQEPCLNKNLTNSIFETCQMAHVLRCVTIDNGRIFRCPQSMVYCERERNYDDAIEICRINNIHQLLNFLERNVPLNSCGKCLGSVGSLFKHHQIKRSDWEKELPLRPEYATDYSYLRRLQAVENAWNGCARKLEDFQFHSLEPT